MKREKLGWKANLIAASLVTGAIATYTVIERQSPETATQVEEEAPAELDASRRAVAARYASCKIVDVGHSLEGPKSSEPRGTLTISLELTQTKDGNEAVNEYWDDDTVRWYTPEAKADVLYNTGNGLESYIYVKPGDPQLSDSKNVGPEKQQVTFHPLRDYPEGTYFSIEIADEAQTRNPDGTITHSSATKQCGIIELVKAADDEPQLWGVTDLTFAEKPPMEVTNDSVAPLLVPYNGFY